MNAQPTIIPPPKYAASPAAWKSKLVLRAWAVLCCIIIAGVGGSIAALDGVEGDFMLLLGPVLVVPFVWSIAEAFCIFKRGGNRGIHPGAVVAADLIIWLGLAFVDLVMISSGLLFSPQRLIEGYYYHNGKYRGDEEDTSDLIELAAKIQGRGRAVVAFLTFLLITHFVLFVVACCETHTRNRMPKTVYVVQQPVYAPEANGQPLYPLAQYPQQQYYVPQQPVPMQSPGAQMAGPKPEAQPMTGAERYA
ncbi:hypothetical protein QBC44DRAFT_331810 [Cladorrhinum sp. PSN332]|nr:hypothetical protein QBC44DRAFT_331810 [Cladorrhinum sp. PSN332]